MRQVFRPHLGQYDWEQCQLIEEKLFPFPQIAQLKHGHLTLDELNRVFRKEFWGDYFSFCFVRNPYDRFLSYCYFINRFNEKMKKDPEKTIYAILDDPGKMRQNLMLKPQHHFTHNSNGNQIVAFIGKVEIIEADLKRVCNRLNIPESGMNIPRVNATDRNEQYSLSDDSKKLIYNFYQHDFELFGYHKEVN